jgi:hypothetical protein
LPRFSGGPEEALWYFGALSDAFLALLPVPLSAELADVINDMNWLSRVDWPVDERQHHRKKWTPHAIEQGNSPNRASQEADFDRQCQQLSSNALDRLVGEVRSVAQARESWSFSGGDPTPTNFCDDFAWAIVNDVERFRENYNDAVREICKLVIGRLSPLERAVLERCTQEYGEMSRDDEPEPDDADRRNYLVNELYALVWTEADDHGWRLKEREESREDDEAEEDDKSSE